MFMASRVTEILRTISIVNVLLREEDLKQSQLHRREFNIIKFLFWANNKREKGLQYLYIVLIYKVNQLVLCFGYELTYMSLHLCCSHTIDSLFLPPYLAQSSTADQQRRGDLHRGLGPGGLEKKRGREERVTH